MLHSHFHLYPVSTSLRESIRNLFSQKTHEFKWLWAAAADVTAYVRALHYNQRGEKKNVVQEVCESWNWFHHFISRTLCSHRNPHSRSPTHTLVRPTCKQLPVLIHTNTRACRMTDSISHTTKKKWTFRFSFLLRKREKPKKKESEPNEDQEMATRRKILVQTIMKIKQFSVNCFKMWSHFRVFLLAASS